MALGEVTGEEANLNAVVELMLDITESTVAFCWELGAGKLQAASCKYRLHMLKMCPCHQHLLCIMAVNAASTVSQCHLISIC